MSVQKKNTPFSELIEAQAPEATRRAHAGDISTIDGVRLAQLISEGDLTSAEAVEAAISRAERVEPQINAIATPMFDEARKMAASGEGSMPTFMKDLVDWKGTPTLYGSQGFRGYVAPEDHPASKAWRAAGMIPLGKSTSSEMGLSATTETLVTGETRNPWNTDFTSGGSSGGSAALVAARVVPFAHATDGGGSIRIPASCCGLFGLKPSRGRTHLRPDVPPVQISASNAVSLTVRDNVATFRASQTDAYEDIGAIKGPSDRRLNIGMIVDSPRGTVTDPEVRAATEATAALCQHLGHNVSEWRFPDSYSAEQFEDRFTLFYSAGAAQFVQQTCELTGKPPGPDIVEPFTLHLAAGFLNRQDELDDAVKYLLRFEHVYTSWFDSMDVLLTPTMPILPFRIGPAGAMSPPVEHLALAADFAAFTPLMNVSGAASMSVPLNWSKSGLPIGSMFSAKRGDDAMLFELAYELEAANPWIDRLPKVHA
jgi:amidase